MTNEAKILYDHNRMCKTIRCDECPFSRVNNGMNLPCDEFIAYDCEEAVKYIQAWVTLNPEKTMLDDVLEKHPNTPLDKYGVPSICPHSLGYEPIKDCLANDTECIKCWHRPWKG